MNEQTLGQRIAAERKKLGLDRDEPKKAAVRVRIDGKKKANPAGVIFGIVWFMMVLMMILTAIFDAL